MAHVNVHTLMKAPMIGDRAKQLKTWPLFKRLFRDYIKNHMQAVYIALFFMVISALMTAGFAKIIEPILNEVMIEKKTHLIWPISLAIMGCFVIRGVATYIHTLIMGKIGQGIVSDIQNGLYSKFLDLDLTFFHENPSGSLIARVISDVRIVRMATVDAMTGFGKSLLTLVFLVALMFWQDWRLTLIAFIFMPVASVFVIYIGRRIRKTSKRIQEQVGVLSMYLSETFKGIRQVKAYGMEQAERRRIEYAVDHYRRLVIKTLRLSTLSTPFNEALIGFALMGLIVYGGQQVSAGNLTAGAFMSFIAAFSLSYEPLKRLAKLNNTIQQGLGAAERVFEMLDIQPHIYDADDAHELESTKPDIVFENVSFQYNPDDPGYALKNVSFTVPAGKTVALVGPSGSGKTTAMNLVGRFYDVTDGRVFVDGYDIRELTLHSLRKHMALVSQDITIFDDTIAANIAYGTPDATREQIEKAADAAYASVFIKEMPQGFDTVLGEDGYKLSGGQKQRIALARAVLRDAPILLLDEATSALDNESEKAIQDSLAKLMKGRTVLVIAHRLSTVQHADHIVVLEEGQVAEQGTHDELLKNEGLYARMYELGFRSTS